VSLYVHALPYQATEQKSKLLYIANGLALSLAVLLHLLLDFKIMFKTGQYVHVDNCDWCNYVIHLYGFCYIWGFHYILLAAR